MKTKVNPYQVITPSVEYYKAEQLIYPGLTRAVEANYRSEYKLLTSLSQLPDPQFWSRYDKQQLTRFLPPVSLLIQQSDSLSAQQAWSRQLTYLTGAIFGRPDPDEARGLVKLSLGELLLVMKNADLPEDSFAPLFNTYRSVLKSTDEDVSPPGSAQLELLDAIKVLLEDQYRSVYEILDRHFDPDDLLTVDLVQAYFTTMLRELAIKSDAWAGWRVIVADGAQMAVRPASRQIKIGSNLPPLSARRIKALFTHEVIVHAGRTVQGAQYNDQLAYGMPGYTESEEGLGVLLEGAIDGQMPYRIVDRYIDISLAMGVVGLPALSRPQLYELVHARNLLRWRADGVEVDESVLERTSWQHVNRIYKGSLGNDIVGVSTKDIVYYNGYNRMSGYLGRFKGPDLERALRFCLSGKINPVNQQHRAYIHDIKFNVNR